MPAITGYAAPLIDDKESLAPLRSRQHFWAPDGAQCKSAGSGRLTACIRLRPRLGLRPNSSAVGSFGAYFTASHFVYTQTLCHIIWSVNRR